MVNNEAISLELFNNRDSGIQNNKLCIHEYDPDSQTLFDCICGGAISGIDEAGK